MNLIKERTIREFCTNNTLNVPIVKINMSTLGGICLTTFRMEKMCYGGPLVRYIQRGIKNLPTYYKVPSRYVINWTGDNLP